MHSFSPKAIWATMSPMSKFITVALLVMAVACIAIAIERIIMLIRSGGESKRFAQEANPLIDKWDFGGLKAAAARFKLSPLATLVGATVATFTKRADEKDGGLTPVELARREANRQSEAIGANLRRGLSVLASVGSIAPFVGLLGTVVGIIAAFQGIASTGSGGLAAVSGGISEALIETALGLMVAIPAVLLFNYLNVRINAVESALGRSSSELLDQMENEYGRSTDAVRRTTKAA